jgi:ribosomal protein L12E/L44/L45/RPP1/RPP2
MKSVALALFVSLTLGAQTKRSLIGQTVSTDSKVIQTVTKDLFNNYNDYIKNVSKVEAKDVQTSFKKHQEAPHVAPAKPAPKPPTAEEQAHAAAMKDKETRKAAQKRTEELKVVVD